MTEVESEILALEEVAAYLKARNLPLLLRRRRAVASWLTFVPEVGAAKAVGRRKTRAG